MTTYNKKNSYILYKAQIKQKIAQGFNISGVNTNTPTWT